ncbi:MAG: alpha/beta fold hydrolase [Anaerolineae bacterium]|nr:alpha/beta fold hydrolase [Anaerolineae bacterium]MCO5196968.1 alpha/beta fold hydrolase [Anaerolineae bacterium]
MRKRWWILLTVVVVVVVIYFAVGAYFANIVINTPTRSLDEALSESDWGSEAALLTDFGLPEPQDVSIDAGDVTLAGWYFENEADADCAVLFLHGYTGTRIHAVSYTPLFWERGCDLLAYDARGHGDSSDAYHSYGYFEKQDGMAAYNWLVEETGLDSSAMGVIGVSYGAATALQMLPLLPDVAFVVADSPYSTMNDILVYQAGEQFGDWAKAFVPAGGVVMNLRAAFQMGDVAPEEAVRETTNDVPVLLVHSLQDEFTPAVQSQAIYDNADKTTTQLQLLDWGSPHAAMIVDDPEAYKALFDNFMQTYGIEFGQETSGR